MIKKIILSLTLAVMPRGFSIAVTTPDLSYDELEQRVYAMVDKLAPLCANGSRKDHSYQ